MADDSEFEEEQSSKGPDLQRYLDIGRRRHMYFLIPLLIGWLIVWGASWVIPPRYQSTTLILVEEPSMPTNYVEPNVSENLQDRLQSITQQILSRTRLLSIIDKLHLFEGGLSKSTPDQKVDLMRKAIDVQLVLSEDQKQITGFTVGYSAADPHVAQQVTGELTDLFIDENLKSRQQASEDTTKFIENELENARTTLAEQEAKVRDFEAKHEGDLPTQQASNLQILSGLQAQLQNEQDALNNSKQQGVYYESLQQQYQGLTGVGDNSPTTLPAIDQQLDSLRSKLANLSSHYTDRYPDVQNLKGEIAKTERMRDELIASLKDKDKGGKHTGDGSVAGDLATRSQNAMMLQLEGQLHANKMEVANRERSIVELKARIDEYQARLNDEPVTEQQLADLSRGYDQSKANFDELLKKKNDSTMATSMEEMQQGERFRMLDPPSLPTTPDFPNRLKFCGIGLGVGLALGLVVAGGVEIMHDRMYSETEIKAELPVAIIAEIPEIVMPSEERSRKKRVVFGWATAVLVVATILAGSAFTVVHDGFPAHAQTKTQGGKNQ
jgi:polysaccharide chain length determinant protein (PEP-CTERM system associated)